jgi:hypothetical protein
MSRRAPTSGAGHKRRSRKTLIWILIMTVIIIGLLYWEKIALLYVLATLGITVLMVLVAMADLGGSKKIAGGPVAPADDAAALGTGISSTVTSGAASSAAAPSATRRR